MGFELHEAAKGRNGRIGSAHSAPRNVVLWKVSRDSGTSADAQKTKSTTRPIRTRKKQKTETKVDRLRELGALKGGQTFSTPSKICPAPKCKGALRASSVFGKQLCDLSRVFDVQHASCRRSVRTCGKVSNYNNGVEGGKKTNALKLHDLRVLSVNSALGFSERLSTFVGAMHDWSSVSLRCLQDAMGSSIFGHVAAQFRMDLADALFDFYAMEELPKVSRRLANELEIGNELVEATLERFRKWAISEGCLKYCNADTLYGVIADGDEKTTLQLRWRDSGP